MFRFLFLVAVLTTCGRAASTEPALSDLHLSKAAFDCAGEESFSTEDPGVLERVVTLLARQSWQRYYVTLPSGFSGCSLSLFGSEKQIGAVLLYDRSPKLTLFVLLDDGTFVTTLEELDTSILKLCMMIRMPNQSPDRTRLDTIDNSGGLSRP